MAIVAAYLELMRFGNPVGAVMVYFPYLYGSLFALSAPNKTSGNKFEAILNTNAILLPAAIMLHSAACSWNDIVDSDIDKKVARTRLRPIPRGAISLRNAYIFTFVETVIWLALLRLASPQTVIWSLPLIPMTILYPYSKRFTHYTTAFLSPIIAWAVYVGFVAMHANPLSSLAFFWGLTCMFLAECIHENILEMIYAHQDLKDDLKAGISSMAIRFRGGPKRALAVFGLMELAFRVATGILMGFGSFYYVVACVGSAFVNTWMLLSVDLADAGQCWWWFQGGGMMIGSILSMGMLSQLWS
jgi:4-hydroxybenzoate polyprenyltransferase